MNSALPFFTCWLKVLGFHLSKTLLDPLLLGHLCVKGSLPFCEQIHCDSGSLLTLFFSLVDFVYIFPR